MLFIGQIVRFLIDIRCSSIKHLIIKAKEGIELLLESNKFALTLDTGHNHVRDNINEPFVLKHEDRLIHMYIHDATKISDPLLLTCCLEQGEVDLKKYFALAEKNNCRVVLETKTVEGLKQSVEWVKNNGTYN